MTRNKQYIIFFLLIFLSAGVMAQVADSDSIRAAHVRLRAGVQQDKINLRWAVDEPAAWQRANKTGFLLKRYQLTSGGKLLDKPEEKNLGVFLPAPAAEWERAMASNDYAAVIAQSLFGESFEVEMGNQGALASIINRSQEQEQRFSFALMAADLDFDVAKMAGWGYTDTDVRPNERYLYTVSVNAPQAEGNLPEALPESGSIIAELSMYEPLPKPLEFIAIFEDKTVTLAWNYLMLSDFYGAYFLEKSGNGVDFEAVNTEPLMPLSNAEGKVLQGMVYVDSLASNATPYSYRLRGKTIFSEYGPWSDVISGEGIKDAGVTPRINNFEIINDNTVNLHWEFPQESEADITSFALLYSPTDAKNSYKVVKENIPASGRQVTTESFSPANYFKIGAIGKNGATRESYSVLVQPNDTVPPAVPAGFAGTIDSLGVVRLTWTANTEKDLEGYHVFRATQKNEEPMRLTAQSITEAAFNDTVPLENLNSMVYYAVLSVDRRKNESRLTDLLEIRKPDRIRPMTPVFISYKVDDNGDITLTFQRSYSDDVAVHRLYRLNEQDQKIIPVFVTREIKPEYTYTDTRLMPDAKYSYMLTAEDKSGLQSMVSPKVTLQTPPADNSDALGSLNGYANKNKKKIELNWRVKADNITEITVYKKTNDDKATLWGTLNGGQNYLEDSDVAEGNTYTYLLKAMLKTKQPTKTQKITIDY